MKEFSFWSNEEIELIDNNLDRPISTLVNGFKLKGFDRSKESIAKKRRQRTVQLGLTNIGIIKPEVVHFSTKKKNQRTLVVPDAHTAPGQDFSRFTALGRYANNRRPENIVFMGDFGNFDSLSKWDAGREASHGKQYKEDIKACKQALGVFLKELAPDYKPRLIFLGGNHDEGRVEEYIETHPQLRGHMDVEEDLELRELGFEYINYRKYLEINGVLFTHAVMNAANKPVSGKNVMNVIAGLTAKSIVVGHHHRFETMSYYRHGADDVQQVLLCGLFSEHTDDYADGAANSYSRCIVELTHYKYGRFDVNQTSIECLKAEYL